MPGVHPAKGELDLATFGKLWVGIVAIESAVNNLSSY